MLTDAVIALLIAVGLVGILIPVLPGTSLVALAVIVWATLGSGTLVWVVAGTAVAVLAVGAVVKYLVPGRRLREAGVPTSTLVAGAVLGVVGFVVVPVVGLPLGFVLGIYLDRWARAGRDAAWPATVHALRAVGLGVVIELAAGLTASAIWLGGAIAR